MKTLISSLLLLSSTCFATDINKAIDQMDKKKLDATAGSIMEKLAADTGGDADKLNALVQQLGRDPAALEQHLTPEQKAQIEALSKQVQQNSAFSHLPPMGK